MGHSVRAFTIIGKSGGCTVVPVADDHAILNDQSPNLLACAVAQFGPLEGHLHVGPVVALLFGRVGVYDGVLCDGHGANTTAAAQGGRFWKSTQGGTRTCLRQAGPLAALQLCLVWLILKLITNSPQVILSYSRLEVFLSCAGVGPIHIFLGDQDHEWTIRSCGTLPPALMPRDPCLCVIAQTDVDVIRRKA